MDIRRLKYFVVLAEELHFGRAATRLSISQPPLSNAIKIIEDELGTALFKRNSKRVSLTAAGTAFYPEALKVLSQLDLACATAQETGAGNRGQLHISFIGGMALRGVPEVVAEFSLANPEIAVSLREMASFEQMNSILSGRVAGGFLHYTGSPHPDLHYLTISDEAFLCCVPKSHPLANNEAIDLRAVEKENLIIFSREASPFSHDNVIGICAAAGLSPTIRHYVTSGTSALMLVAHGAGITLVPDAYAGLGISGVVFLKILGSTTRSMSYFAWRRDNDNAALLAFIKVLDSTVRREMSKAAVPMAAGSRVTRVKK